jgi:hypothetical protein
MTQSEDIDFALCMEEVLNQKTEEVEREETAIEWKFKRCKDKQIFETNYKSGTNLKMNCDAFRNLLLLLNQSRDISIVITDDIGFDWKMSRNNSEVSARVELFLDMLNGMSQV